MELIWTAVLLLLQTQRCWATDDSHFLLTGKDTGFCLYKEGQYCYDLRWTTGDRLLFPQLWRSRCLGAQGKSEGSGVSLYECDEKSELQKWECKNNTVLALKDQELYIELTADNTAVLSRRIGLNNHLTISGTTQGACMRTYREFYTIGGNAKGAICMFPFFYNHFWHNDCTRTDSPDGRTWCATKTKYDENPLWGFCPSTVKTQWKKNAVTGTYYQLNTDSLLTWAQADVSCRQQGASLLSITDPHQQAYVAALLDGAGMAQGEKLWIAMIQSDQSWHWSNGKPYRYLNWDSGEPILRPGYKCAYTDGTSVKSWHSDKCTKKLGYICSSQQLLDRPTEAPEPGYCSGHWVPYNGHCYYLDRTPKSWSSAQSACRQEGGDLVSIHNVEEQSFVISQLGYVQTDQLWIGLNSKKGERLFDWSDQSTVQFTTWDTQKPSAQTSTNSNCVLIQGEEGNWADNLCNEKHGFICMKKSTEDPSDDEINQNIGCKIGWKRHGSYCYLVSAETKTFDLAKQHCETTDSYLADVSNGVDNAFLVSLVGFRPEKYFWIGLSNQENIDNFVWTNKAPVKYTHWNVGMPGHQQGCVAFKTGIFSGLWDVLPCINKTKYICKHLAEGAPLTTAAPTTMPPPCALGWTRLPFRSSCFKLFPESNSKRLTWFDARDYCRAIGGDLLSIHSLDEQNSLPLGYSSAWIGLSSPDTVTGYVWSDGSQVNFQHWEYGEPNNHNNAESCAETKLRAWTGSEAWSDVQCEKLNHWICQIPAGQTPKPTPGPKTPDYNKTSDGWLEWRGNQYFINKANLPMEDARYFCQQRHGDLATINSEAENLFLWQQLHDYYGNFWIGAKVDLDKSFQWMDGSPVIFQRWNEDQPSFNNFDEMCASMAYFNGFWHNYNCGFEYYSICKRSATGVANATAAPLIPTGGCPINWRKLNSKCYRIFTDQKLTWDAARKQCQDIGGNLASINSRHAEVFLLSKMAENPTSDVWIGLRSINGEEFQWTDGQPRKYIQNVLVNSKKKGHSYYFWSTHEDSLFWTWDSISSEKIRCVAMHNEPSIGIGEWVAKPCNDTKGYVCIQNIDPAFKDTAEPTISSDYVKFLNDTFKAVTQPLTWDAANTRCESEDSQLASLQSEWSQVYVELVALTLKTPVWIGMNKDKTGGYFRFLDSWHVKFSHWAMNEPSRDRPCVYMDLDGKWKTAYCNTTMNSVCMKYRDLPPTEPSEFAGICPLDQYNPVPSKNSVWLPYKGYCYKFVAEMKRWSEAATNCLKHGGSLASIEDPSEQEFIQDNAKMFQDVFHVFWIGLYKSNNGDWLWLDNTIIDYTNWAENQPARGIYGELSCIDGTWKTSRAWERPYVCKTKKVPQPKLPQSTTPSSSVPDLSHPANLGLIIGFALVVAISLATIIYVFLKKRGRQLIINKLTNFENPLFFSHESKPDVVEPTAITQTVEKENPEHPTIVQI